MRLHLLLPIAGTALVLAACAGTPQQQAAAPAVATGPTTTVSQAEIDRAPPDTKNALLHSSAWPYVH